MHLLAEDMRIFGQQILEWEVNVALGATWQDGIR